MPDHVHLLVRMRPSISLSDFLRSVKANSSRWVHERSETPRRFGWQEGYAAFSVSESVAGDVCRYIQTQEEHHRRRSFEEEWVTLLKKHGIEFDPADPFGEAVHSGRSGRHRATHGLTPPPPCAMILLRLLREAARRTDAGWSSLVARWAHNPKVAGSNPAPATIRHIRPQGRSRGRASGSCLFSWNE